MSHYNIINGNNHLDKRGLLCFFNSFDMTEISRMYEIVPSSTETIRAWQGHKLEKKWFYCNSGSFVINLIEIDEFENPSLQLIPSRIELSQDNAEILEIPRGYANGFKATKENSRLIIFSNLTLEESKNDDFRFPVEKWHSKW